MLNGLQLMRLMAHPHLDEIMKRVTALLDRGDVPDLMAIAAEVEREHAEAASQ
jgi:hypothetical protein